MRQKLFLQISFEHGWPPKFKKWWFFYTKPFFCTRNTKILYAYLFGFKNTEVSFPKWYTIHAYFKSNLFTWISCCVDSSRFENSCHSLFAFPITNCEVCLPASDGYLTQKLLTKGAINVFREFASQTKGCWAGLWSNAFAS